MVCQTNEQALENCIERALLESSRYEKGNPAECDRKLCRATKQSTFTHCQYPTGAH